MINWIVGHHQQSFYLGNCNIDYRYEAQLSVNKTIQITKVSAQACISKTVTTTNKKQQHKNLKLKVTNA
jgi:hypothetical protein